MTLINPVNNIRHFNNQFAAAPATAAKGNGNPGTTKLESAVVDNRSFRQYILPEFLGGLPKPEPKVVPEPEAKKDDTTAWYMLPFVGLYKVGAFIGEALIAVFHFCTCYCFKGEDKPVDAGQINAPKVNK